MSAVDDLYKRACVAFGANVEAVGPGQWHSPTPCADWDVRELVNHLVGELRWAVPLFGGATVEEVGGRFDGDLLGADPKATWREAAPPALAAVDRTGALTDTVHLSFGDVPGEEYAWQLTADLLVHGWDLARGIGADEKLDAELVEGVLSWFAEREDLYRQGGVVAPRPAIDADADPQTRLLAAFGREDSEHDTLSVTRRFNEAFGSRDVDAVMALMTVDCAFEDTSPPDGTRHEGQAAVRAAWEKLFAASADAAFETEEAIVGGSRATYSWVYRWDGGHVRGVDVFRVADGKVAEKKAYVKG